MLHQPSHLTPDFARIAAWPLTKEDYDQCKESTSATAITFSGTPTVEIDSPYSNFFIPLGQCQDTSIPMPRPHGIELSSSSQRVVLPTECPMSYGGLRSFAQSDFEEPLCPNGFCPSPSPCNDTSWELTFDAWCLLIPEIPHEREDLQQSVLVVWGTGLLRIGTALLAVASKILSCWKSLQWKKAKPIVTSSQQSYWLTADASGNALGCEDFACVQSGRKIEMSRCAIQRC